MQKIIDDINNLVSSHKPIVIKYEKQCLPDDIVDQYNLIINNYKNLLKPYKKINGTKKIQCSAVHSGNRCIFKSSYILKNNNMALCWYCCHIVNKCKNDNKKIPFNFSK